MNARYRRLECERSLMRGDASRGLARRRGIRGDMHRYDDIHAEDVSWSFKVFCRCRRCREERRGLAHRVIQA